MQERAVAFSCAVPIFQRFRANKRFTPTPTDHVFTVGMLESIQSCIGGVPMLAATETVAISDVVQKVPAPRA